MTATKQAFPRAKKAAILRTAIDFIENGRVKIPAAVLPEVAARHELTLDQVTDVVTSHGWPRPDSMRRAVNILETTTEEYADVTAREHIDHAEQVAAGQTLQLVDVDQLHADPDNVREDLGDLAELAKSIRDVGILQPIVARRHDGQLVIVMGHRRHEAAKKAGLHQVPVIVRADDMDPDDVLAAMIVENGQRLDLDPIEEARALARLKRADKSTDLLLAERISKSQAYVSGRLALLSLTPQQQAAVRAGTLPLARAIRLGRNQGGTNRPGGQGKKSAAHLTWHHPLAEKVSITCQTLGHSKHIAGRVGEVGCGHCWEDVIRADERDQVAKKAATR